jgi:malonyl-CoA decarboxylase
MPWLRAFVTLSPLTGFAQWLESQREEGSLVRQSLEDADQLAALDEGGSLEQGEIESVTRPVLQRAAALYLLRAKGANGKPLDPVARFHLGNGARLERINMSADLSAKGLRQSHGIMVNYLYDLATIEKNHEVYAETGEVVCASSVRKILSSGAATNSIARNVQSLLGADRRRKKEAGIT